MMEVVFVKLLWYFYSAISYQDFMYDSLSGMDWHLFSLSWVVPNPTFHLRVKIKSCGRFRANSGVTSTTRSILQMRKVLFRIANDCHNFCSQPKSSPCFGSSGLFALTKFLRSLILYRFPSTKN